MPIQRVKLNLYTYVHLQYFDVHVENSVWCSIVTGLQDMFKTLLIKYLNMHKHTDHQNWHFDKIYEHMFRD